MSVLFLLKLEEKFCYTNIHTNFNSLLYMCTGIIFPPLLLTHMFGCEKLN